MNKFSISLLVGAVILSFGSIANAETASEQRLNNAKAELLELKIKLAKDCSSYPSTLNDGFYKPINDSEQALKRAYACEALRALTKGEAKDSKK